MSRLFFANSRDRFVVSNGTRYFARALPRVKVGHICCRFVVREFVNTISIRKKCHFFLLASYFLCSRISLANDPDVNCFGRPREASVVRCLQIGTSSFWPRYVIKYFFRTTCVRAGNFQWLVLCTLKMASLMSIFAPMTQKLFDKLNSRSGGAFWACEKFMLIIEFRNRLDGIQIWKLILNYVKSSNSN